MGNKRHLVFDGPSSLGNVKQAFKIITVHLGSFNITGILFYFCNLTDHEQLIVSWMINLDSTQKRILYK